MDYQMVFYAEIVVVILGVILVIIRSHDNFMIIKDSLKSGVARTFVFGIFSRRNGIPLLESSRKSEPVSFWLRIFGYIFDTLVIFAFTVFMLIVVYFNKFK